MRRLASALIVLAVTAVGAQTAAAAPPSPGAAGIGDRLFPQLGNGGYDVLHYDLSLRYATSSPSQPVDGTVRVVARATQGLSRFDLDFAGGAIGDVYVNGKAATWTRSGEELVITPPRSLREGQVFSTRVRHFTATPTKPDPDVAESTAFFTTPDGSATADQPNIAHFLYPSNDHPRDKARFTFALDVPAGTTAVANGVLVSREDRDGRWIWRYRQRQPMATELTQVAVGNFAVITRQGQDGVLLRDVVPRRLAADLEPKLATVVQHVPWLRERVGDFPFDAYGSLVVDQPLAFALETQTLSLYDTTWFGRPPAGWEPVMVHELSHQWFGDSVSPFEWSDVWLNEGHATWYENLYAQDKGLLRQSTEKLVPPAGANDLDALMRWAYGLGDIFRQLWGPVARPVGPEFDKLFSPQVYYGGALVLFALRQEVGADVFQAIERAWLRRFRGRSASTDDFIAVASEVAGRDLTAFLRAWLYGTKTPPMPGHADWTVTPSS
jgi:aminopeptidase N